MKKHRLKIQLTTIIAIFAIAAIAVAINFYYSYGRLSLTESRLESTKDLYWKATQNANTSKATLQLEIENLLNTLSMAERELAITQQNLTIEAALSEILKSVISEMEHASQQTALIELTTFESKQISPTSGADILISGNASSDKDSGFGSTTSAASLAISGTNGGSTASATLNFVTDAMTTAKVTTLIGPVIDLAEKQPNIGQKLPQIEILDAIVLSIFETTIDKTIFTSDYSQLRQQFASVIEQNLVLQESINQSNEGFISEFNFFEDAISSMADELNDSQAQVGLLINQLASKNSELAKDRIQERTLNTQLKEIKDELTNQLTLMSVTLLILLAFTVIFGFMITDAIKKSIKYIQQLIKGEKPKKLNFISKDFSLLINEVTTLRNKLEGNQHIEQFLYTMAHEMRTPIASIGANSKNLQELGNKMSEDQIDLAINDINTTSVRMGVLVERLLELAKIDNINELESPEQLGLNNMIHKVLLRHSYKMAEAIVTCDYQGTQQEITGEPLLVEQALMNILDNAINYSEQNSVINIDVTTNQEAIILTVTNQGRAMTEPVIKAVFSGDTYYSEANPLTGQKGNGLGLRFVRTIMKLHQGSLKITSTETPPSTTVSLIFPLS